ncbi:hypothetical protein ACFYO0_38415 [Streptomyces sp. NPDC006365]|uniref:hypothetical protein n=1 Tax=Streptomyces sp. NPDC006365 TaxID=3364744 RepID=UPI0036A5CE6C
MAALDSGGQIGGASTSARDVSEQKRVDAELTGLYEQQRHIALTLQHSLMGTPPEVPGMPRPAAICPPLRGPASAATDSTWCRWASASPTPSSAMSWDAVWRHP